MSKDVLSLLTGEVLEDSVELTLADLCRACRVPADRVIEIVEEGIVEPLGGDPAHWRFHGVSLRRVGCVLRLERDLGVNTAGAALALQLLDEIETLRTRLQRFND